MTHTSHHWYERTYACAELDTQLVTRLLRAWVVCQVSKGVSSRVSSSVTSLSRYYVRVCQVCQVIPWIAREWTWNRASESHGFACHAITVLSGGYPCTYADDTENGLETTAVTQEGRAKNRETKCMQSRSITPQTVRKR
jgi:hypothetical protein